MLFTVTHRICLVELVVEKGGKDPTGCFVAGTYLINSCPSLGQFYFVVMLFVV